MCTEHSVFINLFNSALFRSLFHKPSFPCRASDAFLRRSLSRAFFRFYSHPSSKPKAAVSGFKWWAILRYTSAKRLLFPITLTFWNGRGQSLKKKIIGEIRSDWTNLGSVFRRRVKSVVFCYEIRIVVLIVPDRTSLMMLSFTKTQQTNFHISKAGEDKSQIKCNPTFRWIFFRP